jgi:hypothetical protein
MKMETEIVENLVEQYETVRPMVLTTRWFRRNANLGMKVWRSTTRNFDCDFEVEHVEIGCPNYTLTDRGPVLEKKEKGDDNGKTD